MFIGHHAVGLAAKAVAPRASLTALLSAALFLDLLWPLFLLMGAEHVEIQPGATAVTPLNFISYPWSHSLAMAVLWAVVFAAVYFALTRYRAGAVVVGICVISHWVLDLATHRPDLPLYPGGGRRMGLGLWYSLPATLAVEGAMFVAGVLVYLRLTRPTRRMGSVLFAAYVVTVLVVYLANIFGPPPPSPEALAQYALIAWIIVPWAYGIDLFRMNRRALA